MRSVEKVETAVEPRFQEHFVQAMAIPHDVDPYARLRAAVASPDARPQAPADGRRAVAARLPRRSWARRGPSKRRRAARRAARLHVERVPFLMRTLQPVEVSDEGLSLLEENADRILEEVGIEFHGASDALELFAGAGASVDGERVRLGGLCRSLVQRTAPRSSRRSRNRANGVVFGGQRTIFAPAARRSSGT